MAPPVHQAVFEILYGEGISREGELIELGVEHKIVNKSGAWYSYGDERIGQGKDNVRTYLREHPEMAAEIEQRIRGILLGKPEQAEEGAADSTQAAEVTS